MASLESIVVPPAATAGVIGSRQSRSIADMRAFLTRRGALTASESLRLLRNAYPDAPLSLRVAAAGTSND